MESTPTEAKGQETETTISETTEPTRSGEPETTTAVLEEGEPNKIGVHHAALTELAKKIGLPEPVS